MPTNLDCRHYSHHEAKAMVVTDKQLEWSFEYIGPDLTPIVRILRFDVTEWVLRAMVLFLSRPCYTVLMPVTRINGNHSHKLHGTFRWRWMAMMSIRRHQRPYRFKYLMEIRKGKQTTSGKVCHRVTYSTAWCLGLWWR